MENQRFGLIGHPIAHSLSPLLFNAGYAGEYIYELIEGEEFETSWNKFLDSYDGINVTAPFKEKAWAKADILSDECRLIGASNLIVKTPEGTKAFNSDYLGVRKWLGEAVFSQEQVSGTPQERVSVAVIGCGGAGKAAAAASALMGFRTVLVNRDMSKAQAIVENHSRFASSCPGAAPASLEIVPISDVLDVFRSCDIILYNLPVSLPELSLLPEALSDGRGRIILEANYRNPSFDEELRERVTTANPLVRFTDGKVWLLYQAVTGYEIFTGKVPDLEKMSESLRNYH